MTNKNRMSIRTSITILILLFSACKPNTEIRGKNYIKRQLGTYRAAPKTVAVITKFDSIVVLRIRHKADLLKSIKNAIDSMNIKNAVVLNGIGSLTSYNIHSVSNTTFPTENVFVKEKGPFDVDNLTGFILNGKVHTHITVSNSDNTYGGHLEEGTEVFTFFVLTIAVMNDTDLQDFDNWNWR